MLTKPSVQMLPGMARHVARRTVVALEFTRGA
jgi:hypothetical protein